MNKRKSNLIDMISLLIYIVLMFFLANYLQLFLFNNTELSIYETVSVTNLIIYLVLFVILTIINRYIFQDEIIICKKIGTKFFGYIIVGYIALLFLNSIGSSITSLFGGNNTSTNQEQITIMLGSTGKYAIILSAGIIGPIVEELVFRKTIITFLKNNNVSEYVALIISSILFGLIHVISAGDFVQIFPYLFMGLGLGYIYLKSQSLFLTISVHALQNIVSILITIFLLPSMM